MQKHEILVERDFRRYRKFGDDFQRRTAAAKNRVHTRKKTSKTIEDAKEQFQDALETQVEIEPRFAESALFFRTKCAAVSNATAEAERAFSLMNRIKNDQTNRLLPEHLAQRMRIKLHCPLDKNDIDWDEFEKRFQRVTAPKRGFYEKQNASAAYGKYTKPTDLTVSLM